MQLGLGSHTVHSPGWRANASSWAQRKKTPALGSCQHLARSLSTARGCAWRCACGPGQVIALGRVPGGTSCACAPACAWVGGARTGHASPLAGSRVGLQSCARSVPHSLSGVRRQKNRCRLAPGCHGRPCAAWVVRAQGMGGWWGREGVVSHRGTAGTTQGTRGDLIIFFVRNNLIVRGLMVRGITVRRCGMTTLVGYSLHGTEVHKTD